MDSTPAPKKAPPQAQSGIALFMVIAAMAILSVLVTEFTYVAQVNQKLAYDGLDQLQAHYLAKSGLKISLLRLKAYQQVKALTSAGGAGAGVGLPKSALEKIWSFPFFYPIPTNIPGMTATEREAIEKFQKDSGLKGTFSSSIESESARMNINQMVPGFAAPLPSPSPSQTTGGGANPPPPPPPPPPGPSPSPSPFNPEVARDSLAKYLQEILQNKADADPEFATEYRDLRFPDLMDQIFNWADRAYESRLNLPRDAMTPKRAPFYSMTELHMLPLMDDTLFNLFAPALTAAPTGGINVNTMSEDTLRAIVPGLRQEEIKEFFKFRDNPEEDNLFKKEDDFYNYLKGNVASLKSDAAIKELKERLAKMGINLLTDEGFFKISVQAKVNNATRLLQAWVTLTDPKTTSSNQKPDNPQVSPGGPKERPETGLKILFMKIL